ncbi:MAG: Gfo/Idh/MocA family protein [Planctomycetota bacterium]|jgi:predicted dehydrogenase
MSDFKVALIGLDTSHSIAFTNYIQGDAEESEKVSGMKVISCMRFPSAFQSEEDQDKRQEQLEGWGVKVTTSFDEAVAGADGLMLELNDPEMHLEYFEMAAKAGLPIFLDKPFADTLENAKKIIEIAKANNIRFWTSSSLRFIDEIEDAKEKVKNPVLSNIYGALGSAPKGSDFVWYGCHTVEMLVTAMGGKPESALAIEDGRGVVLHVKFDNDRRGVVECNKGIWVYGGRMMESDEAHVDFVKSSSDSIYKKLLEHNRDFFTKNTQPVSIEESLAVMAVLDAGEKSLKSGKEEKIEL